MDNRVVKYIQGMADEVRKDFQVEGRLIGEDIFKIVRRKGHILLFPLDEEPDLDGFHIKRMVAGKEEAFIYINTAKPVEKNIFCAAHELGHIYEVDEKVKRKFGNIEGVSGEDIINRFAAELLVPEKEFQELTHKRISETCDDNKRITLDNLLRVVAFLMDFYFVPYKAVIYRLEETGFVSEKTRGLMEKYDDVITNYIYDGNYTRLMRKNYVKDMDGLKEDLNFAKDNHVFGSKVIKKVQEDFGIPSTDEQVIQRFEDEYIDVQR